VLLVELGGDAAVLARVLRDAGMEVVYAGTLGGVEQIVRTAEQEDPDALGVVGSAPPEELRNALEGVRVFSLGPRTNVAGNVFATAEEAEKWLSGGPSHTGDTPSDRVR
jgi:methylmalonyl-CoA mutase C-terminal domain/subunit